jgi:hypothetical protein
MSPELARGAVGSVGSTRCFDTQIGDACPDLCIGVITVG